MNFLISIFFLLWTNVYSQHIHGRFIDTDLIGKKIYLYDMFQNDGKSIDDTIIDSNGNFSFNNTDFKLGFYRIQLKNQPPIIIVLNPVETDVEIQVNKQNDDNPITVLQSIENTAFHRHKMLLNIYNRIEYLQFQLSFPNDEVLQNMDEYENELKKFIYYSTVSLKDLQTNFSQTYTFDVFEKSMPIVNTVYEERIEQFFDKKAILDSKYLHSPLMFNKINMYLNYYSGENGVDMHIAIDDILMATYDNYDVYGYSITQILSFLNREGKEELIEYVISEYIGDEFDMITNRTLRKQIEGRQKLKVGTIAPDLQIPDVNGDKVGLHDVYKNNKLNLLFFWSSQCPHCMETIPKIKTIYKSYRSAGLEVIAVSIDKKKEEWQQAINQENLEWINISNLNGWGSESTDVYYVTSTPTFYLVDNEAMIVGRPDGKEEVIDKVNNLLR